MPTELYQFEGSVWSNAPKLALEEGGLKKDKDVRWITINLPEVRFSIRPWSFPEILM